MKSFQQRRSVAAAVLATAVGSVLLLGAGNAWALTTQSYTYDCGSSRAPVLNITIYDDQPGQYQVTDTGQEGPIPPNRLNRIPLPSNTHRVEVLVRGTSPGYLDRSSGVVCDTKP